MEYVVIMSSLTLRDQLPDILIGDMGYLALPCYGTFHALSFFAPFLKGLSTNNFQFRIIIFKITRRKMYCFLDILPCIVLFIFSYVIA